MAINFKVGRHVDPSGFSIAVIDPPALDPEQNLSLIDTSYEWEENVAAIDSSVIESYVSSGGHMPSMTVTDFVVTNITTIATNDTTTAPLYYRHACRFYHYSYGDDPKKQIYITDQNENILRGINFKVRAERIAPKIYKVIVFTDFQNNEFVIYKVKYNRCKVDGTEIYPSWSENLNASPYFNEGNPLINTDEYSLWGPDANGLYAAVVPPVPTLSDLVNVTGVSIGMAPVTVKQDVTNVSEYAIGITVKYTIKATGTSTYTIQRDKNRSTGVTDNYYLQNAASDTWGAGAVNFNIGTDITGIPGIYLNVNGDNYLKTNDEVYFTASRSYYYLKPIAYNSIYLKKPRNLTPDDDWYILVKNGRFRRRMDENGDPVPSGHGILWEYAMPEYYRQIWNMTYGPGYKDAINEKLKILDKQTVQLKRTPLYIEPSSVIGNPDDPGFPPTGYIQISINDETIDQTGILDWDVYNGKVKLAQILGNRDHVVANYTYKEDFFEYTGFFGSGNIYPDEPPFPWFSLDMNPTPNHNYGAYASGLIAHIYLRPYLDVDAKRIVRTESLYHNYTGTPSGVYDFKLGSLSVGPNSRPEDVEIIDVRQRGGGLSKLGIEKIDDVIDVQPEAQFFWDVGYFDGQAVPSNGVLVVRVPKSLLISNGGIFNEDEIKQKCQKHSALGEYIIVEYI